MEKIFIVSDLHGNGPALAAVLGAEPDATRILCLGDLVNYGPDPGECLRWSRTAIAPGDIVIGNHDHLALGIDQTVPPGFPEVLLLGHTHRPFVIERGGAAIVNPGSVGRPKDGDPRASYATWENGQFFLKRVEYRVEETVAGLARVFRGALLDDLAGFLRKGGREVFDDEMAA